MKSIKSILKIAGAVMAVIGTVLVVVGFLDEICAGIKKLAACRAIFYTKGRGAQNRQKRASRFIPDGYRTGHTA